MAATVYRFRWKGCDLSRILSQVQPGVAVAITNAMAKSWVDVSLDPGAPGSDAEADLNAVMLDMDWIPFSINPATPLRAVTTKQSLFTELATDVDLAVVAPFATIATQAITTDAGFLDISASLSGLTTIATYFRLVLDGAPLVGSGIGIGVGSAALQKNGVAVAAGAHTVELQWRLSALGLAQIRPLTSPDSESASLLVKEYVT